jgi:hypothetical protein
MQRLFNDVSLKDAHDLVGKVIGVPQLDTIITEIYNVIVAAESRGIEEGFADGYYTRGQDDRPADEPYQGDSADEDSKPVNLRLSDEVPF